MLDLAAQLLKYTKINNYVIKQINIKQLFYNVIYCLEILNLNMFKTYIKTKLVNSFLSLFKFLVNTFIHFVKKCY